MSEGTPWTPGPWRLSELNQMGMYENSGAAAIIGPDYRVATVDCVAPFKKGFGSSAKCPERDANARLIASAPEMAELLAEAREVKDGILSLDWHGRAPASPCQDQRRQHMSIEWGPKIPVNGVRPAWLADDDELQWRHHYGYGAGQWVNAFCVRWTDFALGEANEIAAIRLPADHWAYPVIAQGYEPWAGGDEPPEDWDGKAVLFKSNAILHPGSLDWQRSDVLDYVIGYKKRTEPTEQPTDDGDYVRVKRMTRDELERAHAEWDGADTSFCWFAKKFGFFKDTSAERFKSAHPEWSDIPDEAIMAAMEWEDK